MQIYYNNTIFEVATTISLQTFLSDLGCDRLGVAAALNQQVIARTEWSKTTLKEGDSVIVIEIAQGG
jgi:sulfur carrier protein